jgi:parvulin-like peptidyl-prolyl isomerase
LRNIRKIFSGILPLFLLWSLFGCTKPDPDEVVATLGDKSITVGQLEKEVQRDLVGYPEEFKKNKKALGRLRKRTLEKMIDRQLLLDASLEAGTVVSEEELQRELKRYKSQYTEWNFQKTLQERGLSSEEWIQLKKENLVIQKFLDHKSSVDHPITPEAVKEYYETHLEEFKKPESVRVRQIVTDTKEKAESILRRLRNGENFAKLARDLSLSPDRKKGGDLGFIVRGNIPREFEVCFAMNPGEVSPIIPSAYGFHIFKVVEKAPAQTPKFQEVEEKITLQLKFQTREKGRQALLEKLRVQVPVEINEKVIARLN